MDDTQLIRYSRHILLPEIDIDGQQRLLDSHALIVGAGGLGSPVALYLAASGIGTLTVCDDDDVDLTNLQRQVAHATDRIGVNKAASARQRMLELNPDIIVHDVAERLDGA
ncbi:MAG: ThiF family adenylyltransferase, partial [Neisseria sp.]|nr:ThiF family adenylyltransferase [Neisseria sp.]